MGRTRLFVIVPALDPPAHNRAFAGERRKWKGEKRADLRVYRWAGAEGTCPMQCVLVGSKKRRGIRERGMLYELRSSERKEIFGQEQGGS